MPGELPQYHQARSDPYAALAEVGKNEDEDPYHFAPSLIRKILAHEGQELGTHTLSHFYALAPGPTLESFRADIKSAKLAADQYGIVLKSIVFPRNQISRQHLRICAEEGLTAYRSMEETGSKQGTGFFAGPCDWPIPTSNSVERVRSTVSRRGVPNCESVWIKISAPVEYGNENV